MNKFCGATYHEILKEILVLVRAGAQIYSQYESNTCYLVSFLLFWTFLQICLPISFPCTTVNNVNAAIYESTKKLLYAHTCKTYRNKWQKIKHSNIIFLFSLDVTISNINLYEIGTEWIQVVKFLVF